MWKRKPKKKKDPLDSDYFEDPEKWFKIIIMGVIIALSITYVFNTFKVLWE